MKCYISLYIYVYLDIVVYILYKNLLKMNGKITRQEFLFWLIKYLTN